SIGERMPEITGLSIREAMQKLSAVSWMTEVEGSGVVVKQYPRAGTKVSGKMKIKIVCKGS
ncbi:MAG: PASTA domain-containing protein, partial [Calditrichia bacterium]